MLVEYSSDATNLGMIDRMKKLLTRVQPVLLTNDLRAEASQAGLVVATIAVSVERTRAF
jgi:glycerate-2-kinase